MARERGLGKRPLLRAFAPNDIGQPNRATLLLSKTQPMPETSCAGNRKGHEGDISSPLNCGRQLPLVPGTISRDSAGKDFSSFRNKMIEGFDVLIINSHIAIGAEDAHFPALKGSFFSHRRRHVSFPSSDWIGWGGSAFLISSCGGVDSPALVVFCARVSSCRVLIFSMEI